MKQNFMAQSLLQFGGAHNYHNVIITLPDPKLSWVSNRDEMEHTLWSVNECDSIALSYFYLSSIHYSPYVQILRAIRILL